MKWLRKGTMCLVTMLLAACMCFSGAFTSVTKAYTEEEKAQAKAWLSAHGYAPTREGAEAAYQDYLDGKFDEEFGINRGSNDSENIGDADGGSSSSGSKSDSDSSGSDGSESEKNDVASTTEEGTTATDQKEKTDQTKNDKTEEKTKTSGSINGEKEETTEAKTAKQSEQKIKSSMIPIVAAGAVLVVVVLGCVGLIWKRRRE